MRSFGKVFPLIAGVAVVVLGLSIIFDIGFPFFRLLVGGLFIYWGIILITKKSYKKRYSCRGEKINVADKEFEKEYSLFFGKTSYDLTEVSPSTGGSVVKVNIAFGAGVIKINKKAAVKVIVNTAFGSAKTPDGTMITFGQHEYTTPSFSADKKHLVVDVDLAFGSVVVE
jgi:hypothetical protein